MIHHDGKEKLSRGVQTGRGGAVPGYRGRGDHADCRRTRDQHALTGAAALRGSLVGAVFHSDHGSQYTSRDFATICKDLGVAQSVGGVGLSADNALAESFNATLKREILQDNTNWADAATCRREVSRWLVR